MYGNHGNGTQVTEKPLYVSENLQILHEVTITHKKKCS